MCVRSSSERCCASSLTEGRTAGGGTGRTWQIIHSGREKVGLNPINEISSSDILRKIFNTISGVNLILTCSSESPSLIFHSAYIFSKPTKWTLLGCLHPQPSSVDSPHLRILLANGATYAQRFSKG